MARRDDDEIHSNLQFDVQIEEISFSGFCFVGGIEALVHPQDANNSDHARLYQPSFGNIVLRRALDSRRDLWNWYKANLSKQNDRRSGTVSLLNEENQPWLTVRFVGAWPCRWMISPLDSMNGEVLLEEVEIAIERFDIE